MDDGDIYGEGSIAGLTNKELLLRKQEQRQRHKELAATGDLIGTLRGLTEIESADLYTTDGERITEQIPMVQIPMVLQKQVQQLLKDP